MIATVTLPRVLLVEDDPVPREALAAFLRSEGYRVEVAEDGARAVRRAVATPPDAIVLDLGLPIVDGFEALRMVRSHHALRGVYVIALTSFEGPRQRERAFEAGCNEYIVKSSDAAVIGGALRSYFAKRGSC